MTLADLSQLRIAVGSFDTWPQLRCALGGLQLRGLAADSANCLALQRIFATSQENLSVDKLAFPNNRETVCCTSEPLANLLAGRLMLGAPSLKDALGHWLVPRHAAYFEKTVESGKILLWVRVRNEGEERHACKSLLATRSNSVGVHDFHNR